MAVVEMKKLSVCALKRHRKDILEALQSMGAMEIRINDIDDEDLHNMETDSSRKQFDKTADAFDKALKAISELVSDKDKQTMFEGLKTVSRAEYNNVIENRDSLVRDSHQVLKLQKERIFHQLVKKLLILFNFVLHVVVIVQPFLLMID